MAGRVGCWAIAGKDSRQTIKMIRLMGRNCNERVSGWSRVEDYLAPMVGSCYREVRMRIVARGTLVGFTRFRVQRAELELFKRHIDSWYAVVRRAQWTNSAELKQQLRSASIVSARRVVFNIKGNDYRLVAEINFQFQILFVKWLGTHKEYDKIDVLSVEYDKERYADPPDSK